MKGEETVRRVGLDVRWSAPVVAVGAVALSVWTGAARAEQGVDFSPDLRPGLTLTYDVSFDLMLSQSTEAHGKAKRVAPEPGDPTTWQGRLMQSARLRLEVRRADDAGRAEIAGSFERLTMMQRLGDRQLEFSWKKEDERPQENGRGQVFQDERNKQNDQNKHNEPDQSPERQLGVEGEDENVPGEQEQARPIPIIPELGDEAAADSFTTLGRTLASSTLRLIVSPRGEVLRVGGLKRAMLVVSQSPGLSPAMLGVFAPGQIGRLLEPIWSADGAAAARAVGEQWRTTRRPPGGAEGRFVFTTDWTLDAVEQDAAEYSGKMRVETRPPEHAGPTTPSVAVVRDQGEVSSVWDVAGGSLRRRESTLSLVTEWSLGGELGLRQSQRAEDRLLRVAREAPD